MREPAAQQAESLGSSARWRIDRWSADGWQAVGHYTGRARAEAALDDLRRQQPDQSHRLIRPVEPPALRPELAIGAVGDRRDRLVVDDRATAGIDRATTRLIGSLGLVALVTLACAASWLTFDTRESTSRSPAAPQPGDEAAAAKALSPAEDPSPPSAEPGLLSGRWRAANGRCDRDATIFLPDREVRLGAAGDRRAFAVAGYAGDGAGRIRVDYAGGGSALFVATGTAIALERVRIADIDIAPQQPTILIRCGPDGATAGESDATATAEVMDNMPADAFDVAVHLGDDLAATLALARGMPANEPLPGRAGQMPLDLVIALNRPVLVGKLVNAGADPDTRDGSGVTALSRAIRGASADLVEALLAAGADPRLADTDGTLPIDHAATLSDQLIIDILLSGGR